MTAILIGLAVFAMLGWMVAAGATGLWWGEKGRREAAERLAVSGNPAGPLAFRLPDQSDPETRVMSMGRTVDEANFSEDTIAKGIEALQTEAKALGRPLAPEEARRQVMAMLHGTQASELDLPGML